MSTSEMSMMSPPTTRNNASDVRPPMPHYAVKVEITDGRTLQCGTYQVLISIGDGQPKWMKRSEALRLVSEYEFDETKKLFANALWPDKSDMKEHETGAPRRSRRLNGGSTSVGSGLNEQNDASSMKTKDAAKDLPGAVVHGSERSNVRSLKFIVKEQAQEDRSATEIASLRPKLRPGKKDQEDRSAREIPSTPRLKLIVKEQDQKVHSTTENPSTPRLKIRLGNKDQKDGSECTSPELKIRLGKKDQKDGSAPEGPLPAEDRVPGKKARLASPDVDEDQHPKKAEAMAHMSNGGSSQKKAGTARLSKKRKADEEDVTEIPPPAPGPVNGGVNNTRRSARQRQPTKKAVDSALEASQSGAKRKRDDDAPPQRNEGSVTAVDAGPGSSLLSALNGASSMAPASKRRRPKSQSSGTPTSDSTAATAGNTGRYVGVTYCDRDCDTISPPTSADGNQDPIYNWTHEVKDAANILVGFSWEAHKRPSRMRSFQETMPHVKENRGSWTDRFPASVQ